MSRVFIYFSFIVSFLFVMMIHTRLIHTSTRDNEIRQSLASSMEATIAEVMKENSHEIENANEFMKLYSLYLCQHVDSDLDLELRLLKVDVENGLLSMRAIGTYQDSSTERKEKKVVVDKTYIFERE